MVEYYINECNTQIKAIIDITTLDIEDIKAARSKNIFDRAETKEKLLKSFQSNKATLDNELLKIHTNSNTDNIKDLLSTKENQLIVELRDNIANLKELNSKYMKFVMSVNEFYSSLLGNILPQEPTGYSGKSVTSPASILKVDI